MKNVLKSLDSHRNFLGLGPEHSSFDSSKIVILPVPYEHSAAPKSGTGSGPQAILHASHDLEGFDVETKREISHEHGIATLQPLNFKGKTDEVALQEIHETVLHLIGLSRFIVTLGGEHIITSAVAAAFAKRSTNLSVLQFDAHSNLRPKFHGDKYNSASVMARVCEYLDPSRLVQVGVRAQNRGEAEFVRDSKVNVFYAHDIHGGTYTRFLKYWDDNVVERLSDNVYVTFDVDAFDPSIMPSTGAPEPGGLSWSEVLRCLRKVGQRKRIVGFDVVEFAPITTVHFPDLVAAKLVLKILNYAMEKDRSPR